MSACYVIVWWAFNNESVVRHAVLGWRVCSDYRRARRHAAEAAIFSLAAAASDPRTGAFHQIGTNCYPQSSRNPFGAYRLRFRGMHKVWLSGPLVCRQSPDFPPRTGDPGRRRACAECHPVRESAWELASQPNALPAAVRRVRRPGWMESISGPEAPSLVECASHEPHRCGDPTGIR